MKREPRVHGPYAARTCGKRQADRSDVRQEIRPLKRARTGFEPLGIADGRQPFMPRVSHNPCLLMLPFRFAHAMRMRPLSVGRVESAFHPARDHYGNVHTFCKENATKILSLLYRSGPGTAPRYRLGYRVKGQSRAHPGDRSGLLAERERRSGKPRRAKHRVHSPMAWRTCRSCHPSHQRLKTPRAEILPMELFSGRAVVVQALQ